MCPSEGTSRMLHEKDAVGVDTSLSVLCEIWSMRNTPWMCIRPSHLIREIWSFS